MYLKREWGKNKNSKVNIPYLYSEGESITCRIRN